jgi:hypothetical protein
MTHHQQIDWKRRVGGEPARFPYLCESRFQMWLVDVRRATIDQHQTRLSFGPVVNQKTIAFASAAHIECKDHDFSPQIS